MPRRSWPCFLLLLSAMLGVGCATDRGADMVTKPQQPADEITDVEWDPSEAERGEPDGQLCLDISGFYRETHEVDSSGCTGAGLSVRIDKHNYLITQSNCSVVSWRINEDGSKTKANQGRVEGNVVFWQGISYQDNNGTITVRPFHVSREKDKKVFTYTASWFWSGYAMLCSGTTKATAVWE